MNKVIQRNTFSILLFIYRSKKNKHHEHPIYCKVTVKGLSRQFSTQIWIADAKWDPKASKVKGTNETAKTANNALLAIRNNLFNIRTQLDEQGKNITAESVVNLYSGKGERQYSLVELHNYYNENYINKLIGKGYAQGTYNRYKISLQHVIEFMRYKYNTSDRLLNELTYSFATDYEFYLKTKRECANNTAVKYIKNLKAVLNFAVENEWIKYNPIANFRGKLEKVDKGYLTEEELNTIKNKELTNERISEVRDVFVFCCYTGLAYSDVFKLTNDNITLGIDGSSFINLRRTKTDTLVKVKLLTPAKQILEKYKDHPMRLYTGRLLPVKSNQKQNAYLKEIAEICQCNKTLTTHIARHTFATLMLTLGVSMESVSSMLGHTDIKTTQIYGKIVAQKVTQEMDIIESRLNKNINTLNLIESNG